MNKTLEAWLRGYVVFDVNGRRFWRYNSANAYATSLDGQGIFFTGFHLFKGWRTFLLVHVVVPTPSLTINARM